MRAPRMMATRLGTTCLSIYLSAHLLACPSSLLPVHQPVYVSVATAVPRVHSSAMACACLSASLSTLCSNIHPNIPVTTNHNFGISELQLSEPIRVQQ